MKLSLIAVATSCLILFAGCKQKTMTLEERLASLPADTIIKIEADSMFQEAYEIDLSTACRP